METTEPLRIVSIGGGNGLSALLRGLRASTVARYCSRHVEVTVIVTVTDDGGSSGRLRKSLAVLPPGDIRRCLVALADEENILSKLFEYRFSEGAGLKGHSFGNLFLAALSDIAGDFGTAVKLSAAALGVEGVVLPSTEMNVTLEAVMDDGSVVSGESRISRSKRPLREIRLRPGFVMPMKEALRAIEAADVVTLGPGSLFTSVIPNLLVDGISQGLHASRATKVYFVNLMSQPGETTGFRASDHIHAIHQHACLPIVDVVVVNNQTIPAQLQKEYAIRNSVPVEIDFAGIQSFNIPVIQANLVSHAGQVRHNSEELGKIAVGLAQESRTRSSKQLLVRQAAAGATTVALS